MRDYYNITERRNNYVPFIKNIFHSKMYGFTVFVSETTTTLSKSSVFTCNSALDYLQKMEAQHEINDLLFLYFYTHPQVRQKDPVCLICS